MKTRIKLTPAQLSLLQEKRGGFLDNYKPGLKLMELGLIDVAGNGYYRWTINSNGEAVLAEIGVKAEQKTTLEHEALDLAWPVLKTVN